MVKRLASAWLMATLAGCGGGADGAGESDDSVVERTSALSGAINVAGIAETATTTGTIDRTNSFFQRLGTNARTCETCHAGSQGWTLTALGATVAFVKTGGLDPLFLPHDEGARPDGDLSTLTSRLLDFGPTLLARGLTRFTRTNPATSEFDVTAVSDPSGFSTTAAYLNFRRPTPTANEALVSSVTWTAGPGLVQNSLAGLVNGAANLHEQRAATAGVVPPDVVQAQVAFQLGLFFAQSVDLLAGRLDTDGATGGPTNLMSQPFHIGINDIQGLDPAGQPFSSKVFSLFDAWAVYAQDGDLDHDHAHACTAGTSDDSTHRRRVAAARAAIYRGQEIFNNFQFQVSGVNGLNDLLGPTVTATCSTCHNSPNVGGHSVIRMFDVGTADPVNCGPMLPLVTVTSKSTTAPPNQTRTVCDLGRANGSHLWSQIGTFRAPPLRGLAARAPYFHDGQAARIEDVVDYFDGRFHIGLTCDQKSDLVAFLRAL